MDTAMQRMQSDRKERNRRILEWLDKHKPSKEDEKVIKECMTSHAYRVILGFGVAAAASTFVYVKIPWAKQNKLVFTFGALGTGLATSFIGFVSANAYCKRRLLETNTPWSRHVRAFMFHEDIVDEEEFDHNYSEAVNSPLDQRRFNEFETERNADPFTFSNEESSSKKRKGLTWDEIRRRNNESK